MTEHRKDVEFYYGPGNETINFPLPEGWDLACELRPNRPENLPGVAEELERAMAQPIGLPPLVEYARGRSSACVVVDDRTRPTPVASILPRVAGDLNAAGIGDDKIVILLALGTHRYMTDEEIAERLGADMVKRFKVVNHDYLDRSSLAHVGRTPTHNVPVTFNKLLADSDLVVSIGCIEAHEQAGYGGGYKNLMPGCAGIEPIHATHNARFQNPPRISSSGMPRLQSRFRQAVDECGALLGDKVYIINTVLDPLRVVSIVAGDPLAAHKEGRRAYREMAAVDLDCQGDVVLVGASPLDHDLRVSFKACFNAAAAMKKGGVMITVSYAHDGLGDLRLPPKLPRLTRPVVKRAPISILEPVSHRFNKSPDQAAGTVSLMKIVQAADAWLYLTPITEGIDALRALGIEFFTDMDALLRRAKELRPRASVVAMPQAGASFVAWD